ncbi:S1 RNA-binding domain-containing protein [Halobacillus locisalis]|uniref:S1 RNA-binding domain-containing protein n=1 Tax=Halobacillus locisalis TaxID=220753 RepID=A0A838CY07_9BACI|nr:S1 RNA-binding domain-containing protein [Halobacillus locisalis]MBA2176823.1 S1 RNA-binding domain-containing protein [Halobacillus locisalis]
MSEVLNDVLIEGFDASKVEYKEKKEDIDNQHWINIQRSYRVGRIEKGMITGFESIKIDGVNEQLCGIIRLGSKIKGIVPLSESDFDLKKDSSATNKFRSLAGKEITFNVISFDEESRIFVASRKQAREQMREKFFQNFDVGHNIHFAIRFVNNDYLVGDIGGVEAFLHVSELSYAWINDLRDRFESGQLLRVQITEINKEKQEVKVSRKALLESPFPDCAERYKEGGEYVATVTGVTGGHIFTNLEDGVDSINSHLKFELPEIGSKVLIRITKVNIKDEKITSRITRTL